MIGLIVIVFVLVAVFLLCCGPLDGDDQDTLDW